MTDATVDHEGTLDPEELVIRVGLDDEGLLDGPVPLIVVDLGRGDLTQLGDSTLGSLPAVVVGVGASGHYAPSAVDLIAPDEMTVELVRATVASAPRASVALALLLRGAATRSIDEALVAESSTYSMLQSGPEFASWRSTRPRRPISEDEEPPVRWWVDGDTVHVRLNRPERHNAVSSQLRDHLMEPLRFALADPALRIVLAGEGPSFSSGGDLDEFGTFTDPASAHLVRLTRSPARLLARLGDRTEAHVHGACLGAGVEWASLCGRVVARRDAVFGLPEVQLGLIPGAGGTASMPARIGRHLTARLALTGERIDAVTAHRWGLVDELIDEREQDVE